MNYEDINLFDGMQYLNNIIKFNQDEKVYFENQTNVTKGKINKYCELLRRNGHTDDYESKINNMLSYFFDYYTQTLSSNYVPYFFSNGTTLYRLVPNNNDDFPYILYKLTPARLFEDFEIPYIDSSKANTIYAEACTLAKHARIKAKSHPNKSIQAKYRNDTVSFYRSLCKYLVDCNLKDSDFPYNVPLYLTPCNLYKSVEGTLYYQEHPKSLSYPLSQKGIQTLFNDKKIPLANNSYNTRDLFKQIKKMLSARKVATNTLPHKRYFIFNNQDVEHYCFHYDQNCSETNIYAMDNFPKGSITIPINGNVMPKLTDNLKLYLCDLIKNDIHSLRTLAMLTAAAFSDHQPLKRMVIFERNIMKETNLSYFLYKIMLINRPYGDLNRFLRKSNMLDYFIKSARTIGNYPAVLITYGSNLVKNNYNTRRLLDSLINGASISFKDTYTSVINIRNYTPIVYAADSLTDYDFLDKNYHCLKMNLCESQNSSFIPTAEEAEWLKRIFLPWGMELLCNKRLDITKKQNQSKETSPNNSIEEFITLFTRAKKDSNVYPEDLYASYVEFFSIHNPNIHPITKGAFIKQVRQIKTLEYRQYHIRQTATHEGSNRYAFRNIEIDTKTLSNYLENNAVPHQNANNLEDALELITEHYKHLFDVVIHPKKIYPARIVSTPSQKP